MCIGREFVVVGVMGNGKHALPVLQCLKRGIAFVSSINCYFFCLLKNFFLNMQVILLCLYFYSGIDHEQINAAPLQETGKSVIVMARRDIELLRVDSDVQLKLLKVVKLTVI